jgi:hypothetical protein
MENNNKKRQVMDILNKLDISNLKGKPKEEKSAEFLSPSEPGISPEEARQRRKLILEADPRILKETEDKERIPAGSSPLDMGLEEFEKRRKKKQMDEALSAGEGYDGDTI